MVRRSKISRKYSKSNKKRSIRRNTKKRKFQRGGVGWGGRCSSVDMPGFNCDYGLICKNAPVSHAFACGFNRAVWLEPPRIEETRTCQRPSRLDYTDRKEK